MLILKFVGKGLLFVVGLVVLYLLIAVLLSLFPTNPPRVAGKKDKQLYISTNGVHTDFIIPVELVPTHLNSQLGYLADYRFLAFGWGDKGFYLDTPTWAELKASTAVKAMFLPSPTAMHITGYNSVGKDWAPLTINAAQLATLNQFINDSFALDADGKLQHIDDAGYGDNDEFYEAIGSYNAIYTCNSWVNDGLKRAKVKTALWSPSEWGIMRWAVD